MAFYSGRSWAFCHITPIKQRRCLVFLKHKFPLFLLLLLISICPVHMDALCFAGQNVPVEIVTCTGLSPDTFLTSWNLAGPVRVFERNADASDIDRQMSVFKMPPPDAETIRASIQSGSLNIMKKTYPWKVYRSGKNSIDLAEALDRRLFVFAYAYTEIVMEDSQTVITGLGSDDAIRVWLNDELVHENWTERQLNEDDDLFSLHMKKGRNSLLLHVQNREYDWGFAFRPLSRKSLPEILVEQAAQGDLDAMQFLISMKTGLNATVENGLNAVNAAKLNGRQKALELLVSSDADTSLVMPPLASIADFTLSRRIDQNAPGIAVLVARNGSIVFKKGYGLAHAEKGIQIKPETIFRIGSVTKQFVASAILKLKETGMLSLDDRLDKYIPDFPRGNEVSIHHLLTHTSGIRTYTSTPDFMSKVTQYIDPDSVVSHIKTLGFSFDPGSSWEYSNSGYFLLGMILQKITGLTWGDYLEKIFFDPLGMDHTGVYSNGTVYENEATGYSYGDEKASIALDWNMSRAGGAGALYSNVRDLFLWNEGIFKGGILSQASLDAAFTPVRLNDGTTPAPLGNSGYGYGWSIGTVRGLKEIGHSGGLNGFNTHLLRYPEQDLTVAVLCNCLPNMPGLSPAQISRELASLFLWQEMESPDR